MIKSRRRECFFDRRVRAKNKIGILCSLFTAITVSRGVVNAIYGGRSLKDLPI